MLHKLQPRPENKKKLKKIKPYPLKSPHLRKKRGAEFFAEN